MAIKGILKKPSPEVLVDEERSSVTSFGGGYTPLGPLGSLASSVISKVQNAISGLEEADSTETDDFVTVKKVLFSKSPTVILDSESSLTEAFEEQTEEVEVDPFPYRKEDYPITAAWRRSEEIRKLKNQRVFSSPEQAIKYDNRKAKKQGRASREHSTLKALENAEKIIRMSDKIIESISSMQIAYALTAPF